MHKTVVLLTALLVLLTGSACRSTPSPAGIARTTVETSARAIAPDEVEQDVLRLVTSAPSYEQSMNARIVTRNEKRLMGERGAGILAVVRITREGAPVELSFIRRTKQLSAVAFGTSDGQVRALYDRLNVRAGEDALGLVDSLAENLKEPARQ